MRAATADTIYSRIEYWLERGTSRSIKGKFYSDSGRLLKIAYYHKHQDQLGSPRPTETILIDAVDSNLVTTINAYDYRYQQIPEPGDAAFRRLLILDKRGYDSHLAMNGLLRGGMGDVEALESVGAGSTAS